MVDPPALDGVDGREERAALRRHLIRLAVVLLAGLVLRLLYLAAQSGVDPWFHRPLQDGAYYLDWARSLARGEPGPPGAFYLAPLYPYLTAGLFRLTGGETGMLFLVQNLLSLATAGMIGLGARKLLGSGPALCAAALFVLYHPFLLFASAPVGETLSLALLVGATLAYGRAGPAWAAAGGLLIGAASLGRPNLLAVAAIWCLVEAAGRRWRECSVIVVAVILLVAPVAWRNYTVSGHPVPVSANGGLTLFHGNGPGARGTFTAPVGMTGRLATQRDEATRLARLHTLDEDMDAVEADRFWGRLAIRTRTDDPWGTVRLLLRRAMLTADSRELGLDYAPSLDDNPWRPMLRVGSRSFPLVPFGLLLGLAAAGWIGRGFRGSGDWTLWGAIAACALTPLAFYVSSRYRLPMAGLLVMPAGVGLAALLDFGLPDPPRRRRLALGVAVAILVVSWILPTSALHRRLHGQGLSVRALSWIELGEVQRALEDAREGVRWAPTSAQAAFNLGFVAQRAHAAAEAEAAYRAAIELEPPGRVDAAVNLGGMLIRSGRSAEAVVVLEAAPLQPPLRADYWDNLVIALHESGDRTGALDAMRRAGTLGVAIDPGLRRALTGGAAEGG